MRYMTVIILLFLLFNTIVAEPAIKSAEEATNLALEYLGFSETEGFTKERNMEKASLVKISDDKTPFLHEKINNREI